MYPITDRGWVSFPQWPPLLYPPPRAQRHWYLLRSLTKILYCLDFQTISPELHYVLNFKQFTQGLYESLIHFIIFITPMTFLLLSYQVVMLVLLSFDFIWTKSNRSTDFLLNLKWFTRHWMMSWPWKNKTRGRCAMHALWRTSAPTRPLIVPTLFFLSFSIPSPSYEYSFNLSFLKSTEITLLSIAQILALTST